LRRRIAFFFLIWRTLLDIGLLPTLEPPDGFLLIDPAQLALGHKPTFSANGAQDTTLRNLFAEALQQLIL
jgi:hypothetical protein